MSRAAADDGLGWVALSPILSVHFLGTLGYSIAIPFLVFVVLDMGGAEWTYGVVGALYSSFQLIGAPLLGRWSDRAGRKRVLVVSQLGTFVAWLVFLVALALPKEPLAHIAGATVTVPLLLVCLARMLDGATGGNMSVASAWVADLTRDQPAARQVAFGRMGMAASTGMVIGPALAGVLGATSMGYAAPVLCATVLSGLCALLTVLVLRDPPDRCTSDPPAPPAVTHVLGQQHKRCDRPDPTPAAGLLLRRDITALLGATFVMFLGFNLFYASFPVHASTALGWDAGTMGLFFALMSGVMIPAQGPLLSAVSARVSAPWVFALGMTGLVAASVAFFVPSTAGALVGAVCFAVGNGLAWPTFQTRIAEAAGAAQGAVQGAATSASSLASIVGLLAGGALYPLVGADLYLIVAGVFALVALGTGWWFGSGGEPVAHPAPVPDPR